MLPTSNEKQPRLPVRQLAILAICRFAEPLIMTGVFPYLPEMIESFGVAANDVSYWAGITSLVFSLAQACTSIQWGRASDRFGRKPTILTALFLSMTTGLLFGFSQNLTWAIVARGLAGAASGNVGILRTTVAEMVPHRSLQPMAFSVMPAIWALGSCFGPILGGMLAVPTRQFPGIFGGSVFFEKFKFALPNMVASIFFTVGLLMGVLFLRETLDTKRNRRDYGLVLGRALVRSCRGGRRRGGGRYTRLPKTADGIDGPGSADDNDDEASVPTSPRLARKHPAKIEAAAHGWRDVFSPQSSLNILAYTILAFHAVTFDQLLPVFLHYPTQDHSPESGNVQLPLRFSGGLGLNSGRIGLLFTCTGIVGIVAQFTVFPPVTRRFGSLRCFRAVTALFPLLYVAVPYVVLLPSRQLQQAVMLAIMFCKTVMCTFAFPCTTILLTNSARSVRILGTLNGVAVATSALGRASGPFTGGGMFTWGVNRGFVVVPWFILAFFAVLGHLSTWRLAELEGPSAERNDGQAGENGVEEETGLLDARDAAVTEDEIALLPGAEEAEMVRTLSRTSTVADRPSVDGGRKGQEELERERKAETEPERECERDRDGAALLAHHRAVDESSPLLGPAAMAKSASNSSALGFGAMDPGQATPNS